MSAEEPTNTQHEAPAAEEESGAQFAPVVHLKDEVEVKTNEEEEEVIFKM